jgi:hypothetical protein
VQGIGYARSNDSSATLLRLGTRLSDVHAENCDFCRQVFCATCLAFHNRANHQKKDALWVKSPHKTEEKANRGILETAQGHPGLNGRPCGSGARGIIEFME